MGISGDAKAEWSNVKQAKDLLKDRVARNTAALMHSFLKGSRPF